MALLMEGKWRVEPDGYSSVSSSMSSTTLARKLPVHDREVINSVFQSEPEWNRSRGRSYCRGGQNDIEMGGQNGYCVLSSALYKITNGVTLGMYLIMLSLCSSR